MVLFEDKVGCSKALYRKTNADANKHQRPPRTNLSAKNWPVPEFWRGFIRNISYKNKERAVFLRAVVAYSHRKSKPPVLRWEPYKLYSVLHCVSCLYILSLPPVLGFNTNGVYSTLCPAATFLLFAPPVLGPRPLCCFSMSFYWPNILWNPSHFSWEDQEEIFRACLKHVSPTPWTSPASL